MLGLVILIVLISAFAWGGFPRNTLPSLATWNIVVGLFLAYVVIKSFFGTYGAEPSDDHENNDPHNQVASKRLKRILLGAGSVALVGSFVLIFTAPQIFIHCWSSAKILIWHDINSNGNIDAGEPGLENIQYGFRYGSRVDFPLSTKSDGSGSISGNVSCYDDSPSRAVGVIPPPGYKFTTADICNTSPQGDLCAFGLASD